jgi:hypothetical protein
MCISNISLVMKRRALLGSLGLGLATTLTGCLGDTIGDSTGSSNESSDAPRFEVDENSPGEFILLAAQPQAPNGIYLHDEFEIGIVLGNIGGEPLSGEVVVELVPSVADVPSQTASVTISADETLPSGASRFYRTGPYQATAVDSWELVARSGITRVDPQYEGKIKINDRSDTPDST